MFQPTRPHGARQQRLYCNDVRTAVSTHAPAWGATEEPKEPPARVTSFNPRARMGRDLYSINKLIT